jgi:hypothetical protein
MSPARKSTRKKKPAAKPPRSETRVEVVAGDRSQRLGGRHECYACGAKFYDLNKPEPVCPKCQANQLERPKDEPAAKPAPAAKAAPRVREMAYLDDEEPATEAATEGEAETPGAEKGGLFDDQVAASTEEDD